MPKLKNLILMSCLLFLLSWNNAAAQPIVYLDSPTSGSECLDLEIKFDWHAEQAQVYTIEISETDTFGSIVVEESGLTEPTYTVSVPEYDATYFWRVSATFTGDLKHTSDVWTFTTKAPPLGLTAPDNDAKCVSLEVPFEWEELLGTQAYHLQVSTSQNFSTLSYEDDNLSTNSATISLAGYNTEYFWRVKSELAECDTEWPTPNKFTTIPQPPSLIAPDDDETGVPFDLELRWALFGQVQSIHLQVADNPEFTNPDVDLTTAVPISNYTITLDQYDKEYFWRVKSTTLDCESGWSVVRSFKTNYENPSLLAPVDAATCVPLMTMFTWEEIPRALSYRLQVATANDFNASLVVNEDDITGLQYMAEMDLPLTEYFWRVRAEDSTNVGLWSEVRSFSSTIKAPELLMPEDTKAGVPKSTKLEWEGLLPGTLYQVQVSESVAMDEFIIDERDFTEPEFDVVLPEYNAEYFWRVSATYTGCPSAWSSTFSFRTVIAPPVLSSPENNSTRQSLSPLFIWQAVDGALDYEINVANSASFTTLVKGQTGIFTNIVQFTDFDPNTDFFWRVRASNDDGTSDWSPTFKFTTGSQGPGIPMLISPARDAKKVEITPTLVWTETDLAQNYHLQVSEMNDFLAMAFESSTITQSSATISNLEYYKTYFWRVAAVNDSGRSNWSEIWWFRTTALAPNEAPILTAPENDMMDAPNIVTFTWGPVDRIEGYKLQISTDEAFPVDNLFTDAGKVWATQAKIYDFIYNTKYYWRVRGWNEAGDGPWSDTWNFTVMDGTSVEDYGNSPFESRLYPNPFNESAALMFNIEQSGNVLIKLYNSMGEEVGTLVDKVLGTGEHTVIIEAQNLDSGVYNCTIQAGNKYELRRLVIIK